MKRLTILAALLLGCANPRLPVNENTYAPCATAPAPGCLVDGEVCTPAGCEPTFPTAGKRRDAGP